jgi:hypothetical protein
MEHDQTPPRISAARDLGVPSIDKRRLEASNRLTKYKAWVSDEPEAGLAGASARRQLAHQRRFFTGAERVPYAARYGHGARLQRFTMSRPQTVAANSDRRSLSYP